MKLDEIRRRIDKIDRELLVLLQERMGLAIQAKKFKGQRFKTRNVKRSYCPAQNA